MNDSGLHVDLVDNHWSKGMQTLAMRISPDDPRASYTRGDYRFASPPHTDYECPFRYSIIRRMVHVPKRLP